MSAGTDIEFSRTRSRVRIESRKPLYHREAEDWYREPVEAVEALLRAEEFPGRVWDPACGGGNIPETLRRLTGCDVIATDKVDRGYARMDRTLDFDVDKIPGEFLVGRCADHVVTNPPFKLAQRFVDRALGDDLGCAKVAVLQRLAWLEGSERGAWFAAKPLARVHVFSFRVSMPPGSSDVPAKGGAVAFCWYVFEHGWLGPPQLRWLRRPG